MRTRGTLTASTSSEGRVSGYVFKLVRESAGRTQQQLAADLRLSAATIQGWESGRRPLMAMPAGQFLALRSRLSQLGATSALLGALTLATDQPLTERSARWSVLCMCASQCRGGRRLRRQR
jgi:transcriptional regulator with XRE-family HTH domain